MTKITTFTTANTKPVQAEAEDEDDALDKFHGSVAIACLDDFEITVGEED